MLFRIYVNTQTGETVTKSFVSEAGRLNWEHAYPNMAPAPPPAPFPPDNWATTFTASVAESTPMPKERLRYNTPSDARMRLDHSIVRYRGIPYFVEANGESFNLNLASLDSSEFVTVDANDSDLDISSVPLGFCNNSVKGSLDYIYRMPRRMQKQGICNENCSTVVTFYDKKNNIITSTANMGLPHDRSALSKTIQNIYPSFGNCLDLGPKQPGKAFTQSYGLTIMKNPSMICRLYYKTEVIGCVFPKENLILLKADFGHSFHVNELSKHAKVEIFDV